MSQKPMDWSKLLSSKRIGNGKPVRSDGRRPYQVDLDRIVFSQPFRRLQDKTQVHPLSPNDHVRRRLTHSIEVASIGRSLGTLVGPAIINRYNLRRSPADFGYILQAACHAHDIGNPPFGHLGEDAIRDWFRNNEKGLRDDGFKMVELQWKDLKTFEGNAQGFRILVETEKHKGRNGLNLTYATLGAYMKYPNCVGDHPGGKEKFGYYQSECKRAEDVANELGLGVHAREKGWRRPPLAFLLEAADDISYAIVDIEDGIELGILSLEEVVEHLRPLIPKASAFWSIEDTRQNERARREALRGDAIGTLIEEASHAFINHEREMREGSFLVQKDGEEEIENGIDRPYREIMDCIEHHGIFRAAQEMAVQRVFGHHSKATKEFASFRIIERLLSAFTLPLRELAKSGSKKRLTRRAEQIVSIMGNTGAEMLDSWKRQDDKARHYQALRRVVDYVSGMTDGYASSLYRQLEGLA